MTTKVHGIVKGAVLNGIATDGWWMVDLLVFNGCPHYIGGAGDLRTQWHQVIVPAGTEIQLNKDIDITLDVGVKEP